MADRYAVIGNPVAHSKSPRIHAEFARQTGEDIVYEAVFAAPDEFEAVVERFRAAGGRGMNVTLPFKHRAYDLASQRSPRAEAAQAVNTLSFGAGAIAGDNTDGVGLVRDLVQNLGCPLHGRRILLMGAGGAAYGVCRPLLDEAPASLTIVNRTPAKAEALRQRFAASTRVEIDAAGYEALSGHAFDVVVNATSAGLDDDTPPLPQGLFAPGAFAYDMVYAETPFLERARHEGALASDGLGMLVEQAAESFYIWRGVRPQTAPVVAMLRKR